MTDPITVPPSFLAQPRWWRGGAEWLADLPRLVAEQCRRWDLRVDGEPWHGSNSLVLPVTRGGEPLVLRLSPARDEVGRQVDALRFWAGRGTVEILDTDPAEGASLLERLGESLQTLPAREAVHVLGCLMRRLAVPAPPEVRSTMDVVRGRGAELEPQWRQLGRPFDEAFLTAALVVADGLARTASITGAADLAVDADLHSQQVLRGRREPWLVVDPVLLRGDIEYDLARVLWTRLDEMPDETAIISHFDDAVAAAEVPRDRARDWVVFRSVDYWLWGLDAGLTEDPVRCRRLLAAVM